MIADTVLKNFEVFAEAPGGIELLREAIFDLATNGHLLKQDESEPKQKFSPVSGPSPIPSNWVWSSLGEISSYGGNGNFSPSNILSTDWVLDLEDIEKGTSRLIKKVTARERPTKSNKAKFNAGDVLYGKLRPYLDKVLVADSHGYCTTEIVPIVPKQGIDPHWFRISLKSPRFLSYVNAKSYGMKMPRLGSKDALLSLHAVPPIAEQKRIVAKVDEVMALCGQLEQQQKHCNKLRIATRKSAIDAISTATTPEELDTAWKRINNNWEVIADTPESVGALRSLILDLAVRGKLMSTFEQVAHSGARFIELGSVMTLEYGKPLDKSLRTVEGQIPVYGANGVKALTGQSLVKDRGIVVGRKGSAGEVNITDGPFWPLDVTFFAKFDEDAFDLQYLYYLLKSLDLPKMARGIKPGINRNDVNKLKVLSFDLAEQKRIVAKVDELMALCDEFEYSLIERNELTKKITRALVVNVSA